MDNVTHLPDGSAFAIASYPLPKNHWLYAERVYMPGHDEPVELPTPVLTHVDRDRVVAAIRYAVRGATMCGKETDFDPDALVQNAVYALCGPYSRKNRMTDKITIDRADVDDILQLCMEVRSQSSPRMVALAIPLYGKLRAALDQSAEQEPVATKTDNGITLHVGWDDLPVGAKLYAAPEAPAAQKEQP